jgi:hypothetical protein
MSLAHAQHQALVPEPLGLGAVVETVTGSLAVRYRLAGDDEPPWYDTATGKTLWWDQLYAVEVRRWGCL